MLQALETFKRQYKKPFTLTHCYWALKDQQKWRTLYASLKNGGQAIDKGEDTTDKEGRHRGKNNSKVEQKRDATTLALQETLNEFLTQKDKTSDKREERREKGPPRERGRIQALLRVADGETGYRRRERPDQSKGGQCKSQGRRG